MITFDKIFGVQGLGEYFLVPKVLELYCGRRCKKALLLDLDIKDAKYVDVGCCSVLLKIILKFFHVFF